MVNSTQQSISQSSEDQPRAHEECVVFRLNDYVQDRVQGGDGYPEKETSFHTLQHIGDVEP